MERQEIWRKIFYKPDTYRYDERKQPSKRCDREVNAMPGVHGYRVDLHVHVHAWLRLLQKLFVRGILRLVDHYDGFPNIPMQLSMHPLMIFMSRELGCFQTNVIHLRSVYFSVPPIASLWLTKCDISINIKKGVLLCLKQRYGCNVLHRTA